MNEKALDKWSAVHFAVGIAAEQFGMPAPWYTALAVGYEIVEQRFETTPDGERKLFKLSAPESALNAASDIAVGLVGYYLSREFFPRFGGNERNGNL